MLQGLIVESLEHAAIITALVFVMMVAVDYADVLTRGKLGKVIRGGSFRQYPATAFLGVTPGCLGVFMNVSFYLRGLISLGAVTGGMIATSGDAAFVMLAMIPKTASVIFIMLFIIGILLAPIFDKIITALDIKTCEKCDCSDLHEDVKCHSFTHYIHIHIWGHIIKRHLWRVFLWGLGALLVVNLGLEIFDIEAFVSSHMVWALVMALLVGLIPDSGPQIIFVVMFAKGIVPFSVLLASSIVQDGHGILPLLSYSVKDSIMVKAFNFIVALIIGFILYHAGL